MPKTSSQCLTNLLSDDGMKAEELFARASVDETSENVETCNFQKQGHEEGGFQECLIINK